MKYLTINQTRGSESLVMEPTVENHGVLKDSLISTMNKKEIQLMADRSFNAIKMMVNKYESNIEFAEALEKSVSDLKKQQRQDEEESTFKFDLED